MGEDKLMMYFDETSTREARIEQVRPLVSGPFIVWPNGTFDCTFDDPEFGPVPFTANPEDEYEHGRLIHEVGEAMMAAGAASESRDLPTFTDPIPIKEILTSISQRLEALEAKLNGD